MGFFLRMTVLADSKKDLRKEAERHRNSLGRAAENSNQAVKLFMETVRPRMDQVVALYYPKGSELDTLPLLRELTRHNVRCALPIVDKGVRLLRFALWNEGEALETGVYKLSQPPASAQAIEPDIVVVPLLAYDRRCHRLGYGAGHYDETLRMLRQKKNIMAIGWAYAGQEIPVLPNEPYDEKLDCVITPDGVLFAG